MIVGFSSTLIDAEPDALLQLSLGYASFSKLAKSTYVQSELSIKRGLTTSLSKGTKEPPSAINVERELVFPGNDHEVANRHVEIRTR
jgi:hypothetical protein